MEGREGLGFSLVLVLCWFHQLLLVKSPSILWVLFGIYGLYAGITEGVEKALVADITPGHQKATLIGLHAALVGVGLFPASALAGLLWDIFGPAAPFYLGGTTGFAAAIGLWRALTFFTPQPKGGG